MLIKHSPRRASEIKSFPSSIRGGKLSTQVGEPAMPFAIPLRKARSWTFISTASIAARLKKPTAKVATIKCALNQGSATARCEITDPGNKSGRDSAKHRHTNRHQAQTRDGQKEALDPIKTQPYPGH
jgi:hypothetical protein